MKIICMNNWYEVDSDWSLVNTLIEEEFEKFIVDKMDEQEAKVIVNKRIEVSATKEFANLFKNSKFQSYKHLFNVV